MAEPYDTKDLVTALLLVLGSGPIATGIGAAVVFFPPLVKIANRRVLAASLGFSAGIMSYVSFIEIFFKSNDSFVEAGVEENIAYTYATLCFFGGVLVMLILNLLVDLLLGKSHHHHHDEALSEPKKNTTRESLDKKLDDGALDGAPMCCNDDPVTQLDNVQKMASVIGHEVEDAAKEATGEVEPEQTAQPEKTDEKEEIQEGEVVDEENVVVVNEEENKNLHKMGLNTAIAIALHNFPEGLATFVATLQDPKVGAVLAIAIAIHNIPEGLCVSLPIYYSTGNRIKGFLWALLSGASEFVAALLGWAILASVFTPLIYAILFGLVGGMMIMISIKELLPTAHVYDPGDSVVSYSFIFGMAVMALSLCLFTGLGGDR